MDDQTLILIGETHAMVKHLHETVPRLEQQIKDHEDRLESLETIKKYATWGLSGLFSLGASIKGYLVSRGH